MATVGHLAAGMAVARAGRATHRRRWLALIAFAILAVLPDLDLIGFELGVPYNAPWGHRGAAHSLAMAIMAGFALSLVLAKPLGLPRFSCFALCSLAIATHGLLDMLTTGGLGVAELWPLSTRRFFFPWHIIPVAPIGPRLFARRGMAVVAWETLEFLPLFVYALWPGRRSAAAAAQSSGTAASSSTAEATAGADGDRS